MNLSRSLINIVILDACRNNPFARSFRALERGLAPVQAPKGTLIAYATAPGSVASDGTGRNSPYTLALSDAIQQGLGDPIESIFKLTRQNVLKETGDAQVPWETSSITGDFYFHPSSQNTATPEIETITSTGSKITENTELDIKEAFEEARREDTKQSWRRFLETYSQDDSHYVALAKGALERIKSLYSTKPMPNKAYASCVHTIIGSHPAELCATSELSPQFGNKYGSMNLADGQSSTAWVEGAAGHGIGQSLLITFDDPTPIRRIGLINGYAKNIDIFRKNGRVRELIVESSATPAEVVNLQDIPDWQNVILSEEDPILWITLEIKSAYAGSKYLDTSISELRLD